TLVTCPYYSLICRSVSQLHSLFSLSFSFHLSGPHRALHSFPTRRSSDLCVSGTHWRSRLRFRLLGCLPRKNLRSPAGFGPAYLRSEEHTSELQSRSDLVCRLLLEKKKKKLITKSII